MINWAYFPRSDKATILAKNVVAAFHACEKEISSETKTLPSNEVLFHVAPHLEALGFVVETGKKRSEKLVSQFFMGIMAPLINRLMPTLIT